MASKEKDETSEANGDSGVSALARKRRMEQRRTTMSESKKHKSDTQTMSKDVLAKIPGIKKQARYVPAVDSATLRKMTKEELALWRKEARRVRNRESAAASRNKTQSRITELEAQVADLSSKYNDALATICRLEKEAGIGGPANGGRGTGDPWTPVNMQLHRQHEAAAVSNCVVAVSPPLSPRAEGDSDISLPDARLAAWTLNDVNPQDIYDDTKCSDCNDLQGSTRTEVPSSKAWTPLNDSAGGGSTREKNRNTYHSNNRNHNSKISRPNACVKNPPYRVVVPPRPSYARQ